jgi:hypothetical protein
VDDGSFARVPKVRDEGGGMKEEEKGRRQKAEG